MVGWVNDRYCKEGAGRVHGRRTGYARLAFRRRQQPRRCQYDHHPALTYYFVGVGPAYSSYLKKKRFRAGMGCACSAVDRVSMIGWGANESVRSNKTERKDKGIDARQAAT